MHYMKYTKIAALSAVEVALIKIAAKNDSNNSTTYNHSKHETAARARQLSDLIGLRYFLCKNILNFACVCYEFSFCEVGFY